MSSESAYDAFARYYDSFLKKSTFRDCDVYDTFCERGDHILEVGCGTGRILEHLLKQDHRVCGVDISAISLETAHRKLETYVSRNSLTLIKHNFTDHALSNIQFSKVLVTNLTYNHVLEGGNHFLRNIFSSMKKGGRIVLHLMYPYAVVDNDESDRTKRYIIFHENRLVTVNLKISYANLVETIDYKITDNGIQTLFTYSCRYYSKEEIKKSLQEIGFSDVHFTEVNERALVDKYDSTLEHRSYFAYGTK